MMALKVPEKKDNYCRTQILVKISFLPHRITIFHAGLVDSAVLISLLLSISKFSEVLTR